MKKIAVDTNVFSYAIKGDTRARAYSWLLDQSHLCLSYMTVAELYHWVTIRKWGDLRVEILRRKIAECSILGFDDDTAWQWAQNMCVPGKPMTVGDAWVAACAMRHGLPLLTHNRKDFEGIPGLVLIP